MCHPGKIFASVCHSALKKKKSIFLHFWSLSPNPKLHGHNIIAFKVISSPRQRAMCSHFSENLLLWMLPVINSGFPMNWLIAKLLYKSESCSQAWESLTHIDIASLIILLLWCFARQYLQNYGNVKCKSKHRLAKTPNKFSTKKCIFVFKSRLGVQYGYNQICSSVVV